ncbi:CLUMA_CG000237, isoform A [Clunio marinus]|uniref:Dynein axonemal assembly factor 1 homolog n=1 Tax=Clunio marinus TaxID=568069 RepID=A0A1J1HES4_9DIPT|nr:CLUMA_CG000237, isoform A [Clunio marinus]
MDELNHEKIIKKIIYKELEPSVLNEKIIRKAILEQGPEDGEAGRLFHNMEIQYDKVTVLRLEFLNILKIDHLWILPNLQVLSLAFNKIDKIENLESLGKLKELNLTYNLIEKLENFENLKSLEVLSVFGNKIKKIENVDCLDKLIIFCAGNNLIESKDGERNGVEKNDKFFRIFIAGLLPDLTYYENRYITKEERDEGKDRFRFKLREIMDNEKAEVLERENTFQDQEDFKHYTNCFVEHLDQHQLFDTLFIFDNEDQGECLLRIGNDVNTLITEFREQSIVITQKIFKIGLEQFEKRKSEVSLFINCVKVGKKKVQTQGQLIIDEFLRKSLKIFEVLQEAADEYTKVKSKPHETEAAIEKFYSNFTKFTEDFNQLHNETWKILMEDEMHLHESVAESNATFEHVIQDMTNEFTEQCKTQFVQLRDVEGNFIDALTESVQSFVTSMASSGKEDEIPEELRASLIDRTVINNYAAGMREMHMLKIDGREDLLISRSKQWVQELCDEMTS